MQLSEQIHKHRKAMGLTQEQLASELGVTPQAISNWERGGYPDICMLPIIASFFKITVDELLGNVVKKMNHEMQELWTEVNAASGKERIQKLILFRRKYPDDIGPMWDFIVTVSSLSEEEIKEYLPLMRELCTRILHETDDPNVRNIAIYHMCLSVPKDEREEWIGLLPGHFPPPREMIRKNLYINDGDYINAAVQNDILAVTELEKYFSNRVPDEMGAERKIKQSKHYCGIIQSLADDGGIPEAWISQYAYEKLVLSAALCASGRKEEVWKYFDEAIGMFYSWFKIPEDKLLCTGVGEIKVSKNHRYIHYSDKDGNEKTVPIVRFSSDFADVTIKWLISVLTSSRWKWFDSIRGEDHFVKTVQDLNSFEV